MFFYLLQHSTLIEKELDKNTKITKIFLYGGISYIVLHATLFIGGTDALLYSLKKYFWLFFILDIIKIVFVNNKDINLNFILSGIKTSFFSNHKQLKNINYIPSKNILKKKKNNFENRVEKKVTFAEDNEYTSDSDSDIGTDIDLDEFKQTLNL